MNKQILNSLIDKVNQGIATEEELMAYNAYLNQLTGADKDLNYHELESADNLKEELLKRIENRIGFTKDRKLGVWYHIAAAASVLVFLSIGSYYSFHKQAVQQTTQTKKQDLAPGGNKAILTLANGQQIFLNDANNGTIANQSNISITKTKGGRVVYNSNQSTAKEVIYNTITTPRGGETSVRLADGTIAYLDAASSIHYPVSFMGNERKVEITGQVYFEVVHNATKPFSVTVKGESIDDIGTHFNINAYDDEPAVKTTLLEGSVKVGKGNSVVLLKPGQAAVLRINANKIEVEKANIEKTMAWKNGELVFDGDNIVSIMREISRWYNADIVYQTSTEHKIFVGSVSRFVNVSDVLKTLELTGTVHFKIEGRRIIVMD